MKRARFSEEQIIAILKEAESGEKVTELCRRHGISDATFYVWRSKYGGLEVSEMRRLRQLEEENRQLKGIVTDHGHPGAQGCAGKKRLRPAVKREMVTYVMTSQDLSQRRDCGLIGITRRSLRTAPAPDRNEQLRQRLRALAEERRRWGCPMLYQVLLREGFNVNHKRGRRFSNGRAGSQGTGTFVRSARRPGSYSVRHRPVLTRKWYARRGKTNASKVVPGERTAPAAVISLYFVLKS